MIEVINWCLVLVTIVWGFYHQESTMKLWIAERIVEAAKESDLEMELREDYSGRGMYGRSTAAVVYDNTGDLLAATAVAAGVLAESSLVGTEAGPGALVVDVDEEGVEKSLEEFAMGLRGSRIDNMGRSSFVIY